LRFRDFAPLSSTRLAAPVAAVSIMAATASSNASAPSASSSQPASDELSYDLVMNADVQTFELKSSPDPPSVGEMTQLSSFMSDRGGVVMLLRRPG